VVPDAIAAFLDGAGAALGAGGAARLRRGGPLLLEAAARAGRGPIRDRVEAAWLRLGGPACVGHRGELADADAYFELLDTLEAEGLPVDRDSLTARLGELYAQPDAEAGERLQVMTIYGAKGLEFDTVILPGLNRQTRGDDPQLLHWFELADTEQVVMCPMRDVRERLDPAGDLVSYIGTVERRRQAMETGRLLYVAATRAVRCLHLLAAIPPGRNDTVAPRGDTLAAALWPAVGEEQAARVLADAGQRGESAEIEEAPLPQVYRRLPADWTLPQPPGAVDRAPLEPETTSEYVEFRWAGEAARLAGNLVHRLLQDIADAGEDRWRAQGGFETAERWCRARLKSEGVDGQAAEPVIDRARDAVERCLASERGRWILAARD
jgi:ATP-dependent exoDNAse (exonuclease V) beta subunit